MYRSQTREYSVISHLNAAQLTTQHVIRHEYPVRSLLFSPDSRVLAASTLDSITLWDIGTQQQTQMDVSALNMAYSPDGALLAVAGRDIFLFQTTHSAPPLHMKGHRSGTSCIGFSPDSRLFASGGMDGMVMIGDIRTRRLVASLEHQAQVRGLAFHPDGEHIITLSWGDAHLPRQMTLWNIRTRQKVRQVKCQTEKNVSFSPDGRLLALDGQVLDADTWKIRYDFRERVIAFSPDSRLAASCRSDFNSVGVWDLENGNQLTLLKGHSEGIWSVAFSPDGKWLASGSGKLDTQAILRGNDNEGDRSARLWAVELEDTKPLQRLTNRLQKLPGK